MTREEILEELEGLEDLSVAPGLALCALGRARTQAANGFWDSAERELKAFNKLSGM